MSFRGPYTTLTFALRNVKLEKNYLSQRIVYVITLSSKQTSLFFLIINLVQIIHIYININILLKGTLVDSCFALVQHA